MIKIFGIYTLSDLRDSSNLIGSLSQTMTFLGWSLGANQLSCPKSGPTDLTVLTILWAPSKQWRSAPEAFRAGHYKDLTETGNRARKVSGTQGKVLMTLKVTKDFMIDFIRNQ